MKLLHQPVDEFYTLGGGDNVTTTTTLYLYQSNSYETAEEYLLFDDNAIVAAVGGSLGLFLGFSCLSVLTALAKKLQALVFRQ